MVKLSEIFSQLEDLELTPELFKVSHIFKALSILQALLTTNFSFPKRQ